MASDAEVFGGGVMSDADVFGSPSMEDSTKTKFKLVGQDIARRTGDVLQLPAAVGDMILGAPANIIGRVKGAGAAINEYFQGGKRSEMEAADLEGRNLGIFESFKTPFQTAVKSLTGAEHYDQRIVEEAFTAASAAAARQSGGVLTAHGVEMLLGTTLDALGVKGISPTIKAARARSIESAAKRAEARRPVVEEPGLSDAEVFGKPDLSTIPEPVEVTPKVLKEIFEKAKDPRNAVDNLFAAAREGRLPVRPLDKSFPPSGEPKGRLPGEGVLLDEAMAASGMRKIINDQAFDLTAIEKVALRDVIKERTLVDEQGKPLRRDQGGFSDKQLLALTGLFSGVTALVLAKPEIVNEIKDRIKRALGMEAARPGPEPEPKEPAPVPTEDGTYLAGKEDVLGPLVVGMAVKGKGGVMRPGAADNLAVPLFGRSNMSRTGLPKDEIYLPDNQLLKEVESPAAKAFLADLNADRAFGRWGDKAATNYLNKYAGTEGDPLKDIEIPFGDGVKRWEDVMDKQLLNVQVPEGTGASISPDARPGEPVFDLVANADTITSRRALKSYLAHVGDFLRQNVDPAKLGQYDLVRAVKETAANDARVAKEMEKAQAASMKDLPVYKSYKDGFKWVELKLPEKLTEEQAKGVRLATEAEKRGLRNEDGEAPEKADKVYVAQDAQGKPIRNSYTEDIAHAATPEEAWLTGRLAEEGNVLGHCVGGYCDAVASGESRIFSLKDGKGRSHATVEVESGGPAGEVRPGETLPDSIVQIKGKGNLAPVAKYLPYVQDFVRSGKWGEVGDLENTGLRDVATLDRDLFKALNDKGELNSRYLTEQELAEKVERHNSQRGSADPKLLAGIAAAGGLAAYFAANPDEADSLKYGVMLGAAGLAGKVKAGAGGFAKGLDVAFGALSTRLGNISPALRLRARDYERFVMRETEDALTAQTPFLKILKDTPEGSPLDMALLNGDAAGIDAALATPEAKVAWRNTQAVLNKFEAAHKQLGRFREGIASYFPRIVTDLDGLKKALGQEQRTSLEEALLKAEAKMIKEQQRGLTDIETSIIVNNSLQARPAGSRLPGYARARGVDVVTPELRPFYAKPTDSLLRYTSAAIQDLEMAKFFGKDLATKKLGGKAFTDVDSSIGNIVAEELKAKTITPEQANDLRALLKARFEGGERQPNAAVQDVRNLTNVALLGQFGSAATQIGDSMMTVYHHGLMPTLGALKQKLTGDSQVTTREFGLVNHIAEELGSNRFTGKALQAVFKANGCAAIDQFAKGLNLNAGLIKNQSLAQSATGRAKLAQRWGKAFGDEFPQLVEDLRTKQITDRVQSLVFSELSDAQPISKMEMSEAYLNNPNGRILYQMKTYMLKQMDVIRRDAYNEIRDGNYVTGAKNLVAVSAAMALSNIPGDIIKDWLSGRDVELDKIDLVENLLRNFGVSRYTLDQISSGKPLEVARDMVLPPYKHYQELYNALKPGAEDKEEAKAMKYVPLIGRHVYDRELGGNEARARAEMLRERIRQRNEREDADPSLKLRRLERKAKREAKQRSAQ